MSDGIDTEFADLIVNRIDKSALYDVLKPTNPWKTQQDKYSFTNSGYGFNTKLLEKRLREGISEVELYLCNFDTSDLDSKDDLQTDKSIVLSKLHLQNCSLTSPSTYFKNRVLYLSLGNCINLNEGKESNFTKFMEDINPYFLSIKGLWTSGANKTPEETNLSRYRFYTKQLSLIEPKITSAFATAKGKLKKKINDLKEEDPSVEHDTTYTEINNLEVQITEILENKTLKEDKLLELTYNNMVAWKKLYDMENTVVVYLPQKTIGVEIDVQTDIIIYLPKEKYAKDQRLTIKLNNVPNRKVNVFIEGLDNLNDYTNYFKHKTDKKWSRAEISLKYAIDHKADTPRQYPFVANYLLNTRIFSLPQKENTPSKKNPKAHEIKYAYNSSKIGHAIKPDNSSFDMLYAQMCTTIRPYNTEQIKKNNNFSVNILKWGDKTDNKEMTEWPDQKATKEPDTIKDDEAYFIENDDIEENLDKDNNLNEKIIAEKEMKNPYGCFLSLSGDDNKFCNSEKMLDIYSNLEKLQSSINNQPKTGDTRRNKRVKVIEKEGVYFTPPTKELQDLDMNRSTIAPGETQSYVKQYCKQIPDNVRFIFVLYGDEDSGKSLKEKIEGAWKKDNDSKKKDTQEPDSDDGDDNDDDDDNMIDIIDDSEERKKKTINDSTVSDTKLFLKKGYQSGVLGFTLFDMKYNTIVACGPEKESAFPTAAHLYKHKNSSSRGTKQDKETNETVEQEKDELIRKGNYISAKSKRVSRAISIVNFLLEDKRQQKQQQAIAGGNNKRTKFTFETNMQKTKKLLDAFEYSRISSIDIDNLSNVVLGYDLLNDYFKFTNYTQGVLALILMILYDNGRKWDEMFIKEEGKIPSLVHGAFRRFNFSDKIYAMNINTITEELLHISYFSPYTVPPLLLLNKVDTPVKRIDIQSEIKTSMKNLSEEYLLEFYQNSKEEKNKDNTFTTVTTFKLDNNSAIFEGKNLAQLGIGGNETLHHLAESYTQNKKNSEILHLSCVFNIFLFYILQRSNKYLMVMPLKDFIYRYSLNANEADSEDPIYTKKTFHLQIEALYNFKEMTNTQQLFDDKIIESKNKLTFNVIDNLLNVLNYKINGVKRFYIIYDKLNEMDQGKRNKFTDLNIEIQQNMEKS